MKYAIVIILFWMNPVDDHSEAFTISTANGVALEFTEQNKCWEHIQVNYDQLEDYVESYHDHKATIGEALCIEKNLIERIVRIH